MIRSAFARELMRKGEQALRSARELSDHDYDGSVNRSYYAMFNFARVALLSVGVDEQELPRTHSGVITAFALRAVQSGRIDPELAAALGRTESLRLRADYTGIPIDAKAATDTLALTEKFVASVTREFDLTVPGKTDGLENDNRNDDDMISEPGALPGQAASSYVGAQPWSLEEERRQARENWLRLREQRLELSRDRGQDTGFEHDV